MMPQPRSCRHTLTEMHTQRHAVFVSCGCLAITTNAAAENNIHIFLQSWRAEVQSQLHWAEAQVMAQPLSLWRPQGRMSSFSS